MPERTICDGCGEYEDQCDCVPQCEKCRESYALRDGMDPTRFCDACAHSIADAMMPPPQPELKDAVPVVLFFPTEADREEFVSLVLAAKPGMIARKL